MKDEEKCGIKNFIYQYNMYEKVIGDIILLHFSCSRYSTNAVYLAR